MSKSDYLKELGDAIALSHWAQSNEKTYEEICDRVVNYICDDPSDEGRRYNHRMKDLLKQKKFIPNSPCWINAGTDMKNLFACYVIDLQDNMNSIMDAAKRMAMIMKEGGGVGVSLTPIRAEGSRVGPEGSKRTASGPVSFLKVFDAVVGAVKSAGVRRGAALANLKTGHPDIIKFIKCKEDQNQINNFNLSVAITDEFMDDVIHNTDRVWATMEVEDGETEEWTARDIYELIVRHMWGNGEPGVQFIDTVNNVDGKYTGRPEFRDFNTGIEVSNPCVTGDTLLETPEGQFCIADMVGKEVSVWNGKKWSKVIPFATGKNEIIEVTVAAREHVDNMVRDFDIGQEDLFSDTNLKNGLIKCTPYHTFILEDGQRIKAADLKLGTRLMKANLLNGHTYKDITITGLRMIGKKRETYCLTEPENHAFTINTKSEFTFGFPVLIGNCGETFLKPNEACNLASINLYHFVNPFWKGKDENKDMALRQELKQTVEDAVEFLNKMLDKSETPFQEINEAVHQSRKVGLGVMGLADYLSAKGIVYGSPEAVHEAADVFAFISKTAEEYSLRKGYKNATLTVQAPTGTTGLVGEVSTGIEPHFLRCWTRHSLKMGDLLMYPKSLRDYLENFSEDDSWGQQDDINQAEMLKGYMESNNLKAFSLLLESDSNLAQEIRKYWPTAHEVTPKQHLAMLAAIQRHVHNSVSKTINLPHDATVDDVRELITTAWRLGCKGFTCYRDGSRDSQPLKAVDSREEDSEEISESAKDMLKKIYSNELQVIRSDRLDRLEEKAKAFDKITADWPATLLPKEELYNAPVAKDINVPCKRPRPDTTYGETVKTKIGCGSIYITVNKDENGTCEVFTNLGRAGGCPSQSEATCRLISLALRSGVKVEDVIDQLKGIRCMNTMRQGGIKQSDGTVVLSCPDAIGKAIEKFHKADMEDGLFIGKMRDCTPEENASIEKYIEKISVPTGINIFDTLKCPDCGKSLDRDGGCIICRHCGYSKCG